MECVILGAGGMMPMPARLTTSLLIRREGRMIMFDAGEGIQLALKRGALGICTLDAVAISHMHADHVLGLPGVMMFRAQCDDPGPLTIIGPPGIEKFVRHTLEDLRYRLNYTLNFVEWTEDAANLAWSWNGHDLTWRKLQHSTFCVGYRLDEAPRPGKFDIEKATALGVPCGPMFGQLQAGKSVKLPDATVVEPSQVLGQTRRGRRVVFATDTRPCQSLEALCKDVDIAFVEGMFTLEHAKEAASKLHSTAAETAQLVAGAGADKLVLMHISPRYTYQDEDILQREAAEFFPGVEVGRGLASYVVPLPD